jgi:hypothetical protein
MAKGLSARVAERTGRKTPSRYGKNSAAFLAVRDDVKQAIDDGWPVKEIWRTLFEERKVSFSYEAFRKYVIRLIDGKTGQTRVTRKEERSSQLGQINGNSADKTSTTGIRNFAWNPLHDKDDLF